MMNTTISKPGRGHGIMRLPGRRSAVYSRRLHPLKTVGIRRRLPNQFHSGAYGLGINDAGRFGGGTFFFSIVSRLFDLRIQKWRVDAK
jgi:hypothetical protein